MSRPFVSLGSLLAFVAVGLGAFGTHGLRDRVTPRMFEVWQTGVFYHLVHAVAIVLVGAMFAHLPGRAARWAAWLFLAGIVLFGGSLYGMALGGPRVLGAVAPLGGSCFLAGWLTLAVAARNTDQTSG